MARLASVKQGLYYPTALRPVRLLRKLLRYSSQNFWIFDPCVGEGLALEAFNEGESRYYRPKLGGVEIEENRAAEAAKRLDKVIHTPIEDCTVHGNIGLIFMNPPYDEHKDGRKLTRIEIEWIDIAAAMLPLGKSMILILPERFVAGGKNEKDLRLCMLKNKLVLVKHGLYDKSLGALKFPDPEFDEFKQYAIIVTKTSKPYLEESIFVEGVLGQVDTVVELNTGSNSYTGYGSNNSLEIVVEKSKFNEPSRLTDSILIEKLFGKPSEEVPIMPLQPMRPEITAAVVAGGMFTGIKLENSVVRGGITLRKDVVTKKKGETTQVITTERMIAHVIELNTVTGETVKYRSDENEEEFGELINSIAERVNGKLRELRPSIWQPADLQRLLPRFSMIHAPRLLAGRQNGLFEAQTENVSVIMRGWETTKAVILVGEPGTGKTITSIAAAVGEVINKKSDVQKILILLPSKDDLISKWREEILLSCRDLKPAVFDVKTISDVQEAFANPGLTFILVKESMVKRTSGWEPVLPIPFKNHTTKRIEKIGELLEAGQYSYKYPEQHYREQNGSYIQYTEWRTFSHTLTEADVEKLKEELAELDPESEVRPYKNTCFKCGTHNIELFNISGDLPTRESEILFCSHCNQMYRTDTRNKDGNAYASIANYINQRYAGNYVLIADEAHQLKGGDTARGYAAGSLIKGAKRVLLMTGTLYNGMASSLFFQLYRAKSTFRKMWGYDQVTKFAHMYGLEQEITNEKESRGRASYSGYKDKETVHVKEIPGIHPAMIATLLPFTVFMKLEDLGIDLPPQETRTLFVDVPEEPGEKISRYLDSVRSVALEEMRDETNPSKSLLSAFTWANGGVYDVYPLGDKIFDEHDPEKVRFELNPINEDILGAPITPKEEALLRIVAKHKREGRPSVVGYLQTERRPIHHRLSALFKQYGMTLVYMPSSVKSRVAFVKNSILAGADAIFCNPNLMREGIDLLEIGATIWYSYTDDAVLVTQFNARNHRIGQTLITYVYYLGYNKTYQAERWIVTAEKTAAMQATHGDVRSGLAALLGNPDLISTVQNHLINFQHYESDMKLDDLPPLEVFERAKLSGRIVTTENWYSMNARWALDKGVQLPVKKNRTVRAVPADQMSLF